IRQSPTVAENLQGIVIRIVYVPRRKNDADRAAQKLISLGAKVDIYQTSDSGNAAYTGKLIVKNGYENYSALITRTIQDIEYLAADNASAHQVYFKDGQQFNLWIAR
ncbi:MAG: hypothetical protein CVU74_01995, partial [Deltaproteobacteria bacterium HGW-Deltaproteobacteria-9]